MKTIIIGSRNPVKVQAALTGFKTMFPDEEFTATGLDVASGVSEQPLGDEETYQGALNRTKNARRAHPDADFWIGIEGGVAKQDADTYCDAWIVIESQDNRRGKAKTGAFFLPPRMGQLIAAGQDLGAVTDAVFGATNSKHSSGAVGFLTAGAIDRTAHYVEAVIYALIPFKNPELFS